MESLTNVGGSQWRSGRKQGCNTGQMAAFVHYNRLHEAEDIKLMEHTLESWCLSTWEVSQRSATFKSLGLETDVSCFHWTV